MEFFRIRRDIPFMRHALVFNVISLVTFLAAVFFLVTRGLHLSIEFTGGTVMEVAYAQPADIGKVRGTVEAHERRRRPGAELRHLARRADPPAAAPRASSKASWSAASSTRCAGPKAARSQSRQGVSDKGEPISKQVCAAGKCRAADAAAQRVRRPAGRRGAGRGRRQGAGLRGRRHHDLPGVPLRVEVRGRGDRRQPARRGHHPRLLRLLPVGVLAGGAGGGAGGAGLFGQRVGGHLRPHPRDLPPLPQDEHRARSSTTPSPAPSAAPSSPTARRR